MRIKPAKVVSGMSGAGVVENMSGKWLELPYEGGLVLEILSCSTGPKGSYPAGLFDPAHLVSTFRRAEAVGTGLG